MSFKEQLKRFKRALARNGLYAASWLVKIVPFGALRGITRVLMSIGFQFIIKQRRLAHESLKTAFGEEKSDREIDQIIKANFENLGRGMMEMLYFLAHPDAISKKVFYEGREHLDRALHEGRGVIAVTAHFGNFPLMMLACATDGYKTSAIIRPARDQNLEEYLLKRRRECGLNTIYAIPRRQCVEDSLKALRNNEILFIPLDQNFGSQGGVFVDFFGQKAATATGPVVFAQRTKAVILPMFIIRGQEGAHRIMIEPPMELEEKMNDEQTIIFNISRITRLIESYIRKYPHEWGWMHRRWKSRPSSAKAKEEFLVAEENHA